jgi:site-specific DNA recombinase
VTLRAVIYARVSQDPDTRKRNGNGNGAQHGRSVEEQLAECRAVIDREDWRLVRTFKDNDRSASRYATKAREEYEALIRYLNEGRADVLVCWEASRAQRDLRAYLKLRDLCAANGVLWSYSGRTYDLSRTDDRFNTGLDALLAERESDVTKDRVQRAVRANAVKGRPHGKLLYGYRREYDAATGKLLAQVPDETQAPILREAARRILAGESLYAVTADLRARSIPGPRGDYWWPETLRRLLVNPGYAAKRVHQGQIIGDAQWPPILSEDEWQRLCRKLKDPARRTHRDTSIKHLLSGIARCGVGDCDNTVRVQKNRGQLSYVAVPCFHVARLEKNVDHLVTEIIIERLSRPDVVDLFAARDHDDIADARQEAAALRERLDQFYNSAAEGEITAAALGRIEARLLAAIADAETRAVAASVPEVLRDIAGQPNARARWEALTMPQRREIIRVLVDVRILPGKRGGKSFDPSTVRITWKGQP